MKLNSFLTRRLCHTRKMDFFHTITRFSFLRQTIFFFCIPWKLRLLRKRCVLSTNEKAFFFSNPCLENWSCPTTRVFLTRNFFFFFPPHLYPGKRKLFMMKLCLHEIYIFPHPEKKRILFISRCALRQSIPYPENWARCFITKSVFLRGTIFFPRDVLKIESRWYITGT